MFLVRLLVLLVIATLFASAQTSPVSHDKDWPTRKWQSSTPESQGMDSEVLAQAFDYVRERRIRIHSLLIARNGRVVLDAYFYPFQPGQLHDVASVTKSITATLIGVAVGAHKLDGVRQTVIPLFPARTIAKRDKRKERIALENLLSMTSGFDCRFRPHEITLSQMRQSKDWVQFMLDLPMAADPGRRFEYCSGGMHLLSGVITETTGSSALEFARQELFRPLGIGEAAWPSDPNGVSHGWGDLHLRPHDMAKIGFLWLNLGRWEDRQIVPAEWMRDAVKPHSRLNPDSEYGYGIWVYPKRDPFVFEGLGRGGQRISVAPAKNLVVVMTGGGFEPGEIGNFVAKALKSDRPLAANPAGEQRLQKAISAAGRPPAPRAMRPEPAISTAVSGRMYGTDANPIGLLSFSIKFSGGNDAVVRLDFAGGRVEQRPAGLDGVPRVSPDGRFGLPVALMGEWEDERTFVLDYDEIANINSYRFRLAFGARDVKVELSERTGLTKAEFGGRRID